MSFCRKFPKNASSLLDKKKLDMIKSNQIHEIITEFMFFNIPSESTINTRQNDLMPIPIVIVAP